MMELGTRQRDQEDAADDKQKKPKKTEDSSRSRSWRERTREHDDNFDASKRSRRRGDAADDKQKKLEKTEDSSRKKREESSRSRSWRERTREHDDNFDASIMHGGRIVANIASASVSNGENGASRASSEAGGYEEENLLAPPREDRTRRQETATTPGREDADEQQQDLSYLFRRHHWGAKHGNPDKTERQEGG